jgi:hypothetical protein
VTPRAAAGRLLAVAAAAASAVAACAVQAWQAPGEAPDAAPNVTPNVTPPEASGAATRVAMRNVDFYVDPDVVLHIRRLEGTMRAKAGGPVLFDDKRSFVFGLDEAEVGLTGPGLTALLNKYVFNYPGAPLSQLRVTLSGSELIQTGRLRKGVSLPFEIRARVSVTPDGRIRLHPTRTRILGVDGARLLDALHLSLAKLIDVRGARGVSIEKDDFLLRADSLLPPPAIEGRVTAARVDGDQLVQVFSRAPGSEDRAPLAPPDATAPAFMYFQGGSLRFGKLQMLDAEMQIVDLDRAAPFAFDLDRYAAQLVAGYSRTLPDQGLEVFMLDVDQLGGRADRGAPGDLPRGVPNVGPARSAPGLVRAGARARRRVACARPPAAGRHYQGTIVCPPGWFFLGSVAAQGERAPATR